MTRLLESTFIDGPVGRLEALVEGPDDAIRIERVAVICHPHPLHGGTMHNKVVFRLARAAREAAAVVVRFNFRAVGQSAGEAGIFASRPFYPMFSGVPNGPLRLSPPQVHAAVHNSGNKVVFRLARAAREAAAVVVRFNFRAVGQSAGVHDGGSGEQDDLRAALRFASEHYPGIPLVAGGFSFGSRVGLRVVCGQAAGVERFLAVGTPVEYGEWDFLADCRCPVHFLHGTNDEHGRRPTMEAAFAKAAEPKTLTWIEASDHFFSDALDELEQAARKAILAA